MIVFLAITAEQLNGIDISVYEPLTGWPPPHPKKGSYVLVVGFPAILREQPRQDRLDFNSLSAMLQITAVAERHIVCQFERAHWVSYNPNGVPSPGTDLGGMSGGPVFSVGNLAFPLVGLVSEFSRDFELLYIKTLSHVPSEF